ncbi:MAG TPA: c-type cytochrome [Anaerolineales bacterium]|nr:c-type cytochrome [Anaerolineales bacterium]
MMKQEWLARSLLVVLLAISALLVGAGWYGQKGVVTLRARMPEGGGWSPGELKAIVGEPLKLRLTSDDVTHSFAVGQLDFPTVDIHPGEMSAVTLTFDQPGKYTYYCTRWCGANHWRMRGTIEVSGGEPPQTGVVAESSAPLYLELGLDIDAPHPAQVTPLSKPAAAADINRLDQVPPKYKELVYYRTHSPATAWEALRSEAFAQEMSPSQVWSLVAALWQANTDVVRLAEGQELYRQNCAACHGENGAGDGVFAAQAASQADPMEMGIAGHNLKPPVDFTDQASMLGASPAILQGKIVRGGMGTGMPYWGPIFTEEQIWSLVDYLWTFQFDYSLEVNP